MDKRTILAFVLIFVIFFVTQLIWKPTPPPPATQTVRQRTEETIPHIPNQITYHNINPSQNENIDITENIILENDRLMVSFSSRGAVINQITLKDYTLSDRISPVPLIPTNREILQIYLSNNYFPDINSKIFQYEITESHDSQTIIFYVYDEENDSVLKKIFTLYDDYQLDFIIEGTNLPSIDGYQIAINSGINITEHNKAAERDMKNSFKFISQVDRELKNVTLNKLGRGEQIFAGTINWAAVRSKYFVMCIIPENRIMTQSARTQKIGETLGFDMAVRYNNRVSNISDHYRLYLGPVNFDILKVYENGMENIAELGPKWLRPLALFFMHYLAFLHRFIPNYGIVIIVFALTIKLLLSPLTKKGLQSSKKMQLIQPLMREIQTKYKHDMQKQQEELKKLYAEHKISPLGGCFPFLLQMPVFFALFPLLRDSINFRQQPFFAWIQDLSAPDPLWILPILMGIFMFVQQKMMQQKQDTTNMDEKQLAQVQSQKMMMYMMPPFMVFIFLNFPSGLVLYWTIFNIFSIIQQYFLNKKQN